MFENADVRQSDEMFALLGSQPDLLADSTSLLGKSVEFLSTDARAKQQAATEDSDSSLKPVAKDGFDPLSSPPAVGEANNAAKNGLHDPKMPIGNALNNNPPNLAGAGQGPGGASTPFSAGGGGAAGGGGGGPAGGNLATLANEGAFGSALASHTGNAASVAMPAANAVSAAPTTNTRTESTTTNARVLTPQIASGGTSQLSGSGNTFTAFEGGITNGQAMGTPAISPLVQATAGTTLSNVAVAIFNDPDPNSTPSDFSVSINWGDNTSPTTGTSSALSTGGFSIAGSHTYAASGDYTIQATITDVASGLTATAYGTAAVADASMTATAATINANENSPINNATVATFTDADSYATAGDFTASIDWGDGSTATSGTVSGSNGNFTVTGSHTYTEGGSYQVSVTIQSAGGSSAAAASTATVTDLPLTGTQLSVTPALTGTSTTLTDTFTDANTSEDPSNYMAQINWGDGWIDDAPVSGSSGSYNLTGSHVYDHPGNYTVTVTVTDASGATLTQTAGASISAASLSASGSTLTSTAGQALTDAQIAAFTDGNTDNMNDYYGPATGYTATVDWGDGSGLDTSPTVMGDENGFYVLGTHTYAASGSYTALVTITNADGVSTTATSTIDATTMTPTGATFAASENVSANSVTVATFTDTQSGSYTGSIDWGDGSTPTSGTVSGSNGSYSVAGSHTYADGGTYPVTVTITNAQGLNTVAEATANVADAALTATPQSVTVDENSPLNNAVLATFTDANPNDSLAAYSASIDWGDGSPTATATITYANGIYSVIGSHTYTSEESFTATVYIGDAGDATTIASPTVTVNAPVINPTAESLSAQEDVTLNNATVATFTAPGQASDYSATIDWGDGNTATGTITGSNGNFTVTGSNTYAEQTGGDPFLVTVTISDAAGDTATALSSATVDGGTLATSAVSVQATEQTAATFILANVSDTDPSYTGDEYSATVDWGDGTQDVANVDGGGGVFTVQAAHTYAEEGSYTATVTVTDPNGITTQTVSDTVSVADAALSPGTNAQLEVTQGIAANGATMAQFTDGNSSEVPSAFTASINWGDGTTTAGVVSGGGGLYSVSGSHTYSTLEPITATITVTDAGGSQVVITTPVTTDPPPNLSDVADFSDTNQSDTSSQFTALIAWGDNSSSYGTVLGGNGMFSVMASHTYAEDGAYPMTTTISGPGGPLVLQSTAEVGDPPLSASQPPQPPPQKKEPEVVTPKVDIVMRHTGGAPYLGGDDEKSPGVRISVDASFYMKQLSANDKNLKIADNLQSSILPSVDLNLIQGDITLGPANETGLLGWSVPNGVRVWWKPKADGPWQLVPVANFEFKATGQAIPILVQGMSVNTGKVTVTFTLGNKEKNKTTSASFVYTVYTGLNVSGGTGNGSPQANFFSQLTAASGYGLTADAAGNVVRTTMPVDLSTIQVSFDNNFFKDFMVNSEYAGGTKENSTVVITAVATKADGYKPGLFDAWAARTFYPDNIASALADNTKDNAALLLPAILTQGLMEQFQTQIYGVKNHVANPEKTPEDQVGGAYGAGVIATQNVLPAWGKRQATVKGPGKFTNTTSETSTWKGQNGTTTVIVTYLNLTGALQSAKLKLPGQ